MSDNSWTLARGPKLPTIEEDPEAVKAHWEAWTDRWISMVREFHGAEADNVDTWKELALSIGPTLRLEEALAVLMVKLAAK